MRRLSFFDQPSPLRVVLVYAFVSSLWILLSDRLIDQWIDSVGLLTQLQTIKGWLFVLVTSAIIYGMIQRGWQRLQRANALLKGIVESTPDAIFVKNVQGRYVLSNQGMLRVVGLRSDTQVLGCVDEDLWPKDVAAELRADDLWVLDHQCLLEKEEELLTAQGRRVFLTTKTLWRDRRGEAVGVIGVARDLTERVAAEKALRESETRYRALSETLEQRVQERTLELEQRQQQLTEIMAELKRSNQELEQFAYIVSHDLREPLRSVESYTQLLAEKLGDRLDEQTQTYLHFVTDGAQRMQQLVRDLLAYSRVGTTHRSFGPTDCAEVLGQVLRDLRVAIAESQATITYDNLPTLWADSTQLGQLLQNLLANAIKFRGDHLPQVYIQAQSMPRSALPSAAIAGNDTSEAVSLKADESVWLFSVRDNGIGIRDRYLERIFVIFKRLHTRREFEGTGVGLAICRKIVERHQGRIWAESEPDVGSTFYFWLPEKPKDPFQ